MSASSYRYQPVQDRNCALQEKIIALAQLHRRYGVDMIYLNLRQAGKKVNQKRRQLVRRGWFSGEKAQEQEYPLVRLASSGAANRSQSSVVYEIRV